MAEIAYTRVGESHIAYRVLGEPGRVDVVIVAGALFPFELLAEDRVASRFVNGLAALGRLVVFDKRGVGLSDPMTDWSRPAHEQWAEDLVAVVEATDLDSPLAVSWEVHGAARHAVAQRPDLFGALTLINPAPFTHCVRGSTKARDIYCRTGRSKPTHSRAASPKSRSRRGSSVLVALARARRRPRASGSTFSPPTMA